MPKVTDFYPWPKNMGTNLSKKYGQKDIGTTKTSATDALKATSKRAVQKLAETKGDPVRNQIADKISMAPSLKFTATTATTTTATPPQILESFMEILTEYYILP